MPLNNEEEDFNKDELEAPAFINEELFTKILKKCENCEKILVKNVKITPASQKGDHFASIMFRANVDYEKNGVVHNKLLIIKTMPVIEGIKMEMLQESHLFETEIGMYTEVLPKFQEILRGAGDETVLGAPVLYHSLKPYQIIVMEDLIPQGYEVIRDRALNEEELKAAYSKLAKWHAVSYKLNFEQPEYFEKYRYHLCSMPNFLDNDYMKDTVKFFHELLQENPTLSKYAPHFEAIKEDLLKDVGRKFEEYRDNPQAGAYYVLCHGDFHIKNMMLKHDAKSGKLQDVMLLDFQLSHMGSIANDLIYSYYMLLHAETRPKFDELLYYYFNIFTETLKKIGYKGKQPKLIELRKQLLNSKTIELFLMVSFMPMWEAIRSNMKLPEPEEMLANRDTCKLLYENEKYVEQLQQLLPRFLHSGYFDN